MIEFVERDAKEVFEEEFLEFAGYNLQRRALPDARDGLKWGARKLLHAQMLGKLTHDKPFKKAIKSVSQAMGYSYTHGDASAYGTFIRMAKPFAYRYPLQEVNGNYGTLINPDDHSASRYVEMRGSELAAILLRDLDKDVIDEWEDTYDLEGQFPKVLPAKGFYGITNGCISIGSGMSCSIPPTNLKEVNNAIIKLLWNPDIDADEIICLPDFPTGATILNENEVRESLKNGNGFACRVRAEIEFDAKDRCLIVKQMPYSTYTNTICKELATLMENDENCGIKEFIDYTGTEPDLRIYLTKNANVNRVLTKLYKETSLQTFFSINMVMLDEGKYPRVFGWKEMLQAHIDHEIIVYRRGFEYDKKKIEKRLHILDGLLICAASIEEVVKLIKSSSSALTASTALQKNFLLDEEQAKAVLDMKLARIAHLEIEKLIKEKEKLNIDLERIIEILENETLLKKEIEKGLKEVAEKFGDARRTKVINLCTDNEEPIEKKAINIALTSKGDIFAIATSTLYTQRRGGVGTKAKLDKNEFVKLNFAAQTTDTILLFSNKGNVYSIAASTITLEERTPLCTILNLKDDEAIVSATTLAQKENIIFITKNGMLKKSKLSEYKFNRRNGVKALTLRGGDEVVDVLILNDEKIGILTAFGYLLITETASVNAIGRIGIGVKGINLSEGDFVVSARIIPDNCKEYISISGNGLIKGTDAKEFFIQGRGTKGKRAQKILDKDILVDFLPIIDEKEVIVSTNKTLIKIAIDEVPVTSTGAQGVRATKLTENSKIVGLSL